MQVAFNQKRNTVRISSKDLFAVGSVWIADMLHVTFRVSLSSSLSCHLEWGATVSTCSVAAIVWRTPSASTGCFSTPSGLPSALRPQPGP